jgi:hypothetical protein
MASTQNVFKSLVRNNKTTPRSNLTPKEHLMLKPLTEDLMFIIFMFMADTNLGPCIMERDRYILKALTEHLEKGNVYKCLTPGEAYKIRNSVETAITTWSFKYHKHQPNNEITYLK